MTAICSCSHPIVAESRTANCAKYCTICGYWWDTRYGSVPPGAPEPPPHQNLRVVKIGRNDPCPCGSGRKYKKCCLTK